jgi:hypothetical protein
MKKGLLPKKEVFQPAVISARILVLILFLHAHKALFCKSHVSKGLAV